VTPKDIEHRALAIGLVSQDQTLRAGMVRAVEATGTLAHVFQVAHALTIEEASSNGATMVLVDCMDRTLDPFALYAAVERARGFGETDKAFIALIDESQFAEALSYCESLGFDLLLPRTEPTLILGNLISLDRYRRAVSRGPRLQFSRAKPAGDCIGAWRLRPLTREVECPGGVIKKLTDAEWNYVDFLVKRDLTQIAIPAKLALEIDGHPRLNALVYKLKKKLGEDFPIVSQGNGKYGLAPPAIDPA